MIASNLEATEQIQGNTLWIYDQDSKTTIEL